MWINNESRPVAVGTKFFSAGVTDVAWTPDGRTLLACSFDGTVGAFHFEANELGKPVPDIEVGWAFSLLRCGSLRWAL